MLAVSFPRADRRDPQSENEPRLGHFSPPARKQHRGCGQTLASPGREEQQQGERNAIFFVLFPTTPGGTGTEPSLRGGMITHVRVPAAAEIDPASLAGSPALIYRRCASRSIDAPAPSSWRRKVWTPG